MNDEQDKRNEDPADVFGEVIYSYTRAQALADGVLVDVTAAAREVGFKVPVAMTIAAWKEAVEPSGVKAVPPSFPKSGTDERGRLHDVVWVLRLSLNRAKTRVDYEVLVARGDEEPKPVKLKAL